MSCENPATVVLYDSPRKGASGCSCLRREKTSPPYYTCSLLPGQPRWEPRKGLGSGLGQLISQQPTLLSRWSLIALLPPPPTHHTLWKPTLCVHRRTCVCPPPSPEKTKTKRKNERRGGGRKAKSQPTRTAKRYANKFLLNITTRNTQHTDTQTRTPPAQKPTAPRTDEKKRILVRM